MHFKQLILNICTGIAIALISMVGLIAIFAGISKEKSILYVIDDIEWKQQFWYMAITTVVCVILLSLIDFCNTEIDKAGKNRHKATISKVESKGKEESLQKESDKREIRVENKPKQPSIEVDKTEDERLQKQLEMVREERIKANKTNI